jgi:hypothetical protein
MEKSNNTIHPSGHININNNEETQRGAASSSGPEITINIRPLLEDVSELMTKHISRMLEGFVGDYTTYKQTHDAIMGLPCIKQLQDRILILEDHIRKSTSGSSSSSSSTERPCGSDDNVLDSEERKRQNVSDYNEVLKLKKSIDQLTEHIRHLESQVSNEKNDRAHTDADVENELRLEIQETDLSNNESIQEDNSHFCDTVQTNKIVYGNNSPDITNDDDVVESEDSDEETVAEAGEEAAEEQEAEAEKEAEDDAEEEEAEEAEAEKEAEEEEEEAEEEEAAEEDAEEGEEEEEEEEEAVDEEAEEEAEEEAVEEDTDEIEVSEIKIKGKKYFTTNPQNGIIYACVDDDVGDEVGVFKNGVAFFNNKK